MTELYFLEAEESGDLASALRRIGADPRAGRYLQPKRRTLRLFAPGLDFRAAAFVKQELLSRGGDAAVAKHVIDGKAERSDVLMMGTDSQFRRLLQKLEAMDCWGLKELREALREALGNEAVRAWSFPLPGGRTLTLGGGGAKLMGILNLTPDSFHAPSRVEGEAGLLRRAEAMLAAGADILDVGAESTRPGAAPLPEEEELTRLLPALKALRRAFPHAVLSVDTYKGSVALAAAGEGADIINDVGGGILDKDMFARTAQTGLPYVLSHIRGTPATMRGLPPMDDPLTELHRYFKERLDAAGRAGLTRERIILDPGLGFGKRGAENLLFLKEVGSLRALGRPILIGHSRKGFIGEATGAVDSGGRLAGTVALSALLEGKVELLRVHDVEPNRQALQMARAVREAQPWA